MNRISKLTTSAIIPQNRQECDDAIKHLGDNQRELTRIETQMNDEIAQIKSKYEEMADPLRDKNKELTIGVETWCAANRDEITNGGKIKTAEFHNGEVKWRNRPPKVTLRKVDDVIDRLKAAKLSKFIRTKFEVNKDAILEDPDKVKNIAGISIGSEGEDFVIEPHEQELAS